MIDIIIPILNEEDILSERKDFFMDLKRYARLIFVDGGSTDQSTQLAQHYGETIYAAEGRGVQKNAGAFYGKASIILFLHVDIQFDPCILAHMNDAIEEGALGGCFKLSIEDHKIIFRFYEKIVNFRARYFHVIDGDLGMFVRRDIFHAMGGFEHLRYLEDLLFSRRLRKRGKVMFLNSCVKASSRKWYKQGFFRTFFLYILSYIRYWSRITHFFCFH